MSTDRAPHDVRFVNGQVRLAGSLHVPESVAASAAVVLVGGSGPSDRDNDGYFPPVRRRLVAAGIAVLSYDKRGVGESSGDWREATMDDLAADAGAALDFLRTRPGIPAGSVGLFGHSEGGWVVLRAAAARGDLPWVITNSCPGVTPAVQERHALANALHASDTARRDTDSVLALYDRLIEAGRGGADFAAAAALVDAAGGGAGLGEYWAGMDERLWTFLARKQDHDPVRDVVRLNCPHLAIFGGADDLVPVADSIRVFGAAACDPGRDHRATLTVRVYPGGDHRVRTEGGTRLAPGYPAALARWIMDHTDPVPRG